MRASESSSAVSPLLLVLMGAALPCVTNTEPGRIQVGLYTIFQPAPPAEVREAAREELAGVVMPVGILVHWRPEADNSSDPWWNRIATIEFKGRCEASELRAQPPHPWIFGQTRVNGGKVVPYAEIHCDSLRAYLAPTLVSMPPGMRAVIFGRALGRVVAHELYHMLAKTRRHGTAGIGKESFTPAELTADEFQFQDEEVHRLRQAILTRKSPACEARE